MKSLFILLVGLAFSLSLSAVPITAHPPADDCTLVAVDYSAAQASADATELTTVFVANACLASNSGTQFLASPLTFLPEHQQLYVPNIGLRSDANTSTPLFWVHTGTPPHIYGQYLHKRTFKKHNSHGSV